MENPIVTHARIAHEGATPTRWMLFLHGIFGMGSNFRSFAKALAARVPDWGFLLVDLRGHGASQGFQPPHTLAAAAEDIARLVGSLDVRVDGIAGHSFGGKVTLAYLARRDREISNAFVLDSVPSARPSAVATEDAMSILALLEGVAQPLSSREELAAICERAGLSKRISDWLMMNVRRSEDAYRIRLDLPAIHAMMRDYYDQDYWYVIADPNCARRLDLVVGGASTHFSETDLARARALEREGTRVHLSVLEDAGHWLHTDDPEGLLDVMASALRY